MSLYIDTSQSVGRVFSRLAGSSPRELMKRGSDVSRDPPEERVAAWVSANDQPIWEAVFITETGLRGEGEGWNTNSSLRV